MTLTDLAIKFGCDKYYSHSYIPFYEQLFKGRHVRRLLEIGIGYVDDTNPALGMRPFVPFYVHGASLKMWSEYWPDAEIFGCDIRPDTIFNEGRIRTTVCDQSDPLALRAMAQSFLYVTGTGWTNFDVIIDDGSHQEQHQISTARILFPFLAKGGVYIIEDIRDMESGTFIVQELAPLLSKRCGGTAIDFYQFNKRPDDNLVVIRK